MQIHYENLLPALFLLPQIEINSQIHAETRLEQILASHGEELHDGNRYLIGRLQRQITLEGHRYPDMVKHDYILTRSEGMWIHHCAVYIVHTPYDYDFDMFEMRPIEEQGLTMEY